MYDYSLFIHIVALKLVVKICVDHLLSLLPLVRWNNNKKKRNYNITKEIHHPAGLNKWHLFKPAGGGIA